MLAVATPPTIIIAAGWQVTASRGRIIRREGWDFYREEPRAIQTICFGMICLLFTCNPEILREVRRDKLQDNWAIAAYVIQGHNNNTFYLKMSFRTLKVASQMKQEPALEPCVCSESEYEVWEAPSSLNYCRRLWWT